MIPGINYIKDFTEYSKLTKEMVEIDNKSGKVIPFDILLSRIDRSIDHKAFQGKTKHVVIFSINNLIEDKVLRKKIKENKAKRIEILSRVFERFGYNVKCFSSKGFPSLEISW